jgi:3',5'-cyclic-AMP phosphodiesterase
LDYFLSIKTQYSRLIKTYFVYIIDFHALMNRRNFLSNALLTSSATLVGLKEAHAEPVNEARTRVMRVAHLTDIHVSKNPIAEAGLAKALKSVQSLSPKVDCIFNGGDAILDALDNTKEGVKQQWDVFKGITKNENALPMFSVIGNHDIWGWYHKASDITKDRLYGKMWALEMLNIPKRYYSFEKSGWKFIFLDSVQLNPAGGYVAFFDDKQIEWLKAELAATPPNKPICITSHIPILAACAGLFMGRTEQNGDLLTKRDTMHTDFFKLKNIFKNHPNVQLCLSGHIHLQDEVKYLGVTYYCNGAVCGNWWKGAFQDFAPAYAVIDFYNDGSFERQFVNY